MPKSGPRVHWTESEWERLSDMVIAMRVNDPHSSLIQLANRAVAQFPKDRQRKLIGVDHVKPIEEAVIAHARNCKGLADELHKTRQKLAAAKENHKSAEALILDISDDEVMAMYGERVLQNLSLDEILHRYDEKAILSSIPVSDLAAELTRRIFDSSDSWISKLIPQPYTPVTPTNHEAERKHPIPPKPIPTIDRNKRVVIMGGLPGQVSLISRSLKNVEVIPVPKGQEIPPKADLYVCWTKFISHKEEGRIRAIAPPAKYVRHAGGLSAMTDLIRERV